VHSLIFTLRKPYPPVGGAPMRVWQDINLLRRLGPVTVVSSADFSPDRPALPLDVELELVPRAEGRRRLDRRLLRAGRRSAERRVLLGRGRPGPQAEGQGQHDEQQTHQLVPQRRPITGGTSMP